MVELEVVGKLANFSDLNGTRTPELLSCSIGSQSSTLLLASSLMVTDSVALVRERTIPSDTPPLFGEVSANFCG
jgi:hypothetical protein